MRQMFYVGQFLRNTRMKVFISFAVIFAFANSTEDVGSQSELYFNSYSESLQHLVVEPTTGSLFVGGTNRLYQLDSELRLIQEVRTGPVIDDKRCIEAFGENPCSGGGLMKFEAVPTNNINKVLAIDPTNLQLITCGSVYQGICQTRQLSNISNAREHYTRGNTDYFVAANDPHSSTVAFVAPGPENRAALYVAVTYTAVSSSTIRQTVPAVSSRHLAGTNAFRFSEMDGLTGGTFVRLRREAIEKYSISYVAGFSVSGFSYFLANQPETYVLENSGFPPTVSSNRAAKIVQVCQKDKTFYSYVEMPLRCRSNGDDYYDQVVAATIVRPGNELAARLRISTLDFVLLAAFSKSVERTGSLPSKSAVCLFTFTDIRHRFTQNIQKCFSAEQKHVGSQFSNRFCVSLGLTINSSYCGEAEQNGPLVGMIPLEATPIFEWQNVALTSIAATVIQDHTVVFLGTSDGHLKKLLLQGDGINKEYEDVTIEEGASISRDLVFSANSSYLYAMTSNKVIRVPLAQCDRHTSCDTCRAAKDPYCGWCSLEKKCSTKSECMFSDTDNRWLSHNAWECIRIPPQFVNPVHIGIKKSVQVTVGIKALPVLQGHDKYLCVFGSNISSTVGIVSPNEVKCQTPRLFGSLFPPHHNKDHVNLTLYIRSTQTAVDFLETTLTFYDCAIRTSCSACSQSAYDCSWCVLHNTCMQSDEVAFCPDIMITEHHMCPRLRHSVSSGDILIPAGVMREISLPAVFLPTVKNADLGYECLIHLTAPPIRVPARRVSALLVTCEAYQYTYEPEEATKTVSLEVVWNRNYCVDDNYGITVTVYKCEYMAEDCSTCLNLQEMDETAKYGCQWCGDQCTSNSTCSGQASTTCPLPDIQEVYPLTGPLEGGTLLTIRGTNLGRNFDEVHSAVRVCGEPCELVPSEYVVSRQIICKTGSVTGYRRGNIVVTVGDATVSWEAEFTYQSPQLAKIYPVIGPKAGGTKVTLEGVNLNSGANIQVLFDYIPCRLDFINRTSLVCTTSTVHSATALPVSVRFDGVVRQLDDVDFEYTDNPIINKIHPLTGFRSGGRLVTVWGERFDSIQHPIMHLHKADKTHSSKCTVRSSEVLYCLVPSIDTNPEVHKYRRRSAAQEFEISFTMDGVETVRDLPAFFPGVKSTFTLHPDPVYSLFEDRKKVYKGEALILMGYNLNLACEADEVRVLIGNETCKVNSLDSTTLYCTPPASQPLAFNGASPQDHSSLPAVRVVVGNLVYEVGQLEYQKMIVSDSEYWIIGVAVGGGTLLTIIFIILIVYKRKSTHAERNFKKLNQQLDTLESNIRNECKQAFAELQTEVSDFTSDLNAIGIPFRDYTTYSYKVLFPASENQMILNANTNFKSMNRHDEGMQRFYALLSNVQFVLLFVRTLEHYKQQKTFTIRDKAKVASLLMVIFHDRMDYATLILRYLLSDLIDNAVEDKQHNPKLMLRRTESVVEKMLTNWMSMCMYGCLRAHVGNAMFMLYKAIKHQTEKGPIDVITSDARYSLSEDRLLREKIEPHTLSVYVLVGGHDGVEPIPCKMLDCDTITQAKEKALDAIFKNTPYSTRPSVEDIDIELVSRQRGRILLRDEDNSSESIKGWKKINTLAHYKVQEGATMVFKRKSNILDTNGRQNGIRDHPNGTLSHSVNTPILSVEEGSKLFHLVPHDDAQHAGHSQKVVSEIFLTRLLSTKSILQPYVDDLFLSILRVDSPLVTPVKYLFDFLENAARVSNITDPEVLHTWKSNSLLLRFWVNIIKNPEFVFDIHKSPIVDSCLSVITQTFMDSCSIHDQRLGKDSPSSKLLYAKDIPRYRNLVSQFYQRIHDMAPVSDQEMANIMAEHSSVYRADFNVDEALRELFSYAHLYHVELLEFLGDSAPARKQNLAQQFDEILAFAQ